MFTDRQSSQHTRSLLPTFRRVYWFDLEPLFDQSLLLDELQMTLDLEHRTRSRGYERLKNACVAAQLIYYIL